MALVVEKGSRVAAVEGPHLLFFHERLEAPLGSFALVTTMDSSLVLKKKDKSLRT